MTAQIEQIRQSTSQLLDIILSGRVELTPEVETQLADLLNAVSQRVEELRGQQEPIGGDVIGVPPPIPEGADLLWILSGGQPEVFAQYIRQFPNAGLNALANNTQALNTVITTLQQQFPQGALPVEDGIQKSRLQSSNIWGFQYNPRSAQLVVRFQGGKLYKYDHVPPAVFQILQAGAVPAKTNGRNRYGRWWQGKTPSLGASMHQLIKLGGFPYQRLN